MMEEEALRGWWNRDLFEEFRKMLGNGDADAARKETARKASR